MRRTHGSEGAPVQGGSNPLEEPADDEHGWVRAMAQSPEARVNPPSPMTKRRRRP